MQFHKGQRVLVPMKGRDPRDNYKQVGEVTFVDVHFPSRWATVNIGLFPTTVWDTEATPYDGDMPIGSLIYCGRNCE